MDNVQKVNNFSELIVNLLSFDGSFDYEKVFEKIITFVVLFPLLLKYY